MLAEALPAAACRSVAIAYKLSVREHEARHHDQVVLYLRVSSAFGVYDLMSMPCCTRNVEHCPLRAEQSRHSPS